MDVDRAPLRDNVNAEVELHADDRLDDSIATAVEDTLVESIQLATDSGACDTKSTLNGLTDVTKFRLIESKHYLSRCRIIRKIDMLISPLKWMCCIRNYF